MILATGFYVANDTMMKVAIETLPPYQVLTMRGLSAFLWGLPLLLLLGYGRALPHMFERRVLARNLSETGAVLCFIVALANMPIADATAIGQITPLVVLLGASIAFREHISGRVLALIACGFAGALLVAQPTGEGISVYALLAIGNAVLGAIRDLVGRRIAAEVPGMIVAMSAAAVVLVASVIAHFAFEQWVVPGSKQVLLLLGAGLFLIFGHFFLFMAYRVGPTSAVVPFYYCFTVWAVLSGLTVFGHVPNGMAVAGICLIVLSGLLIVFLDRRRRRLAPVA